MGHSRRERRDRGWGWGRGRARGGREERRRGRGQSWRNHTLPPVDSRDVAMTKMLLEIDEMSEGFGAVLAGEGLLLLLRLPLRVVFVLKK